MKGGACRYAKPNNVKPKRGEGGGGGGGGGGGEREKIVLKLVKVT